MEYDRHINESFDPLHDLIKDADKPIILWGHTLTGKSSYLDDAAEQLQLIRNHISSISFIFEDDNDIIKASSLQDIPKSHYPLITSNALNGIIKKTPSLIEWDWVNKDERTVKHLDKVISKYFQDDFYIYNRLVLCAHPTTKQQSLELLGPELKELCKKEFDVKKRKYQTFQLDDRIISSAINVAVYPSVERWLSWAKIHFIEKIVSFIEEKYLKDPADAFRELYGFYFGHGKSFTVDLNWQVESGMVTIKKDPITNESTMVYPEFMLRDSL